MSKKWLLSLILILFLGGCANQSTPVFISTFTPTFLPTETSTLIPAQAPSASPTATSLPLVTSVCSPLQGIALSDLRLITSNPFYFKYPFSEGPSGDKNHPAVDLGFYHFKSFSTDAGFPIQALLPGKVVEVLDNRFPYGNMILIETPLQDLSPELQALIKIPQPYPDEEIKTHSTCQPDQSRISWSDTAKSIYSLYAHMQAPSTLKPGDIVQCGELIGAIGASGNSSTNIEHLHLEIRIGPADAKFGTISDYLSSSTPEERYNYCIWALSEIFLPINPTLFWDPANVQGQ